LKIRNEKTIGFFSVFLLFWKKISIQEEILIARIWHGVTKACDSDAFLGYIRQTGEKAYRETEGNTAVLILRRAENDTADFLLISLWNSLDAVKNFAGDDYEKAVYLFPGDEKYLIELEPNVAHYEAILNPDLQGWRNLK